MTTPEPSQCRANPTLSHVGGGTSRDMVWHNGHAVGWERGRKALLDIVERAGWLIDGGCPECGDDALRMAEHDDTRLLCVDDACKQNDEDQT